MKTITLLLFLSAQLFSQTKHTDTDFYLQDKKSIGSMFMKYQEKLKKI